MNMKMKKYSILTAAAMTLCLLTGCGGGDSKPAIDKADLIGTWTYKIDGGSDTITLKDDDTYHKVVKLSGYPDTVEDDSWSLEGADVTIYISEYNTAFTYSVAISEDKKTMVWDNGDNRIIYSKKQ